MVQLLYKDLAFTTPPPSTLEGGERDDLITAVARSPFAFTPSSSSWLSSSTKITLNVELFGDTSWDRILCFVPGVCESAETWTVQNLARICQDCRWRLAVLELEGHGLSDGRPAVLPPLQRLVEQVVTFCKHVVTQHENIFTFALSGASLGGCLAAYASQEIGEIMSTTGTSWKEGCAFAGAILISPAVGVNPAFLPPQPVVACLTVLATVMPSVGFMTPVEDPSHYNCPSWTTRNFSGPWPLQTSKYLLDLHRIVSKDLQTGTLHLRKLPEILVISGSKDPVVPMEAVTLFVKGIQQNQGKSKSQLISLQEIPNGDHGLLVVPLQKQKKVTKAVSKFLIEFLGRNSTMAPKLSGLEKNA
jgi:alpha-beta hydrolase superfamily lysophospholipase